MSVKEILTGLEQKLVTAAELLATGVLQEPLYLAMLDGIVGWPGDSKLPKVLFPKHIAVLKVLTQWKEDELIPPLAHTHLSAAVLAASKTTPLLSETAAVEASRPEGEPIAKRVKLKPGEQTLFNLLPDANRTFVGRGQLRDQRLAAGRGEDFVIEPLDARTLPVEQKDKEEAEEEVDRPICNFPCPKCTRTFSHQIALANHIKWHNDATKEKRIVTVMPISPTCQLPVTCKLSLSFEGLIGVSLLIGGKTGAEVAADIEEAAKIEEATNVAMAERWKKRDNECRRRERARDAQAALLDCDPVDGRSGSRARQRYTAKDKLKILEVFDEINANPSITQKVKTFEADRRGKGIRYSTVTPWSKPKERARISTHASKLYAATLLVIDKVTNWRKKGKYAEMEKQLYSLFKLRRAKGRKVSGRWLTAMARQLMKTLHPLVNFKAGKDWRRRFSKRFGIGVRRKTNCKNKSWSDSEPILLRFLAGLRKRMQLDDTDAHADLDDAGVESEPEDINPEAEVAEDQDAEQPLDSSDEEQDKDDTIILITLAAVLPKDYTIAPTPSTEQVTFRNEHAGELVDKKIIFNWAGYGWSVGTITGANTDKRKKYKGEIVNFFAYYSDDTEGKHVLELDTYGGGLDISKSGQWILLQPCIV